MTFVIFKYQTESKNFRLRKTAHKYHLVSNIFFLQSFLSSLQYYFFNGRYVKLMMIMCFRCYFYTKEVCLRIRLAVVDTIKLSITGIAPKWEIVIMVLVVQLVVLFSIHLFHQVTTFLLIVPSKSYVYKLWLHGHGYDWSWTSLEFFFSIFRFIKLRWCIFNAYLNASCQVIN